MYGPAGVGKTAIAKSVAETCTREGLPTASFFSRISLGRNDLNRFIPTFVYQLIRSIPETAEDVITAIEEDTSIFSRPLSTQIQIFVTGPLKRASMRQPLVVILDGLDECGPNAKSQVELLNVLGMAVRELQHIPLTFIITSRPEDEILMAFNSNDINFLTKRISLDNDIWGGQSGWFRDGVNFGSELILG